MIKFLADYLNYEKIKINISNKTSNEDLLGKTIIENDSEGKIKIKNAETVLLSAINFKKYNPIKKIFFQNLNLASPAVMETLSSIFTKSSNILLPDGSMVKRGNMNIIGIFNPQSGSSRDILPNSLLYNSIYHIVESPNDQDIKDIIEVLFKQHNLPNDEMESFTDSFFKARNFSSNTINEISLSLTDIKKYIEFRKKCPSINTFIINQFIFAYRFSKRKNIEELREKLGFTRFKFKYF